MVNFIIVIQNKNKIQQSQEIIIIQDNDNQIDTKSSTEIQLDLIVDNNFKKNVYQPAKC